MTGMLASVVSLDEAQQVLHAGVDIIDLKAPASGVLGALPPSLVGGIVAEVAGRRPVSATTGDLPMEPEVQYAAAQAMAATGVDFVKIGFFPGGDWPGTIAALADLTRAGIRLIAVLLADRPIMSNTLERLVEAKFAGVMLDTQDKISGSLTTAVPMADLRQFVLDARAHGMLCGLAGSLRASDVPSLLALNPDYLGFRGALCQAQRRTAFLDGEAVASIRALIPQTDVHPN